MSLVVVQSWSERKPRVSGILKTESNDSEIIYVPDSNGHFVAQRVTSQQPPQKVKQAGSGGGDGVVAPDNNCSTSSSCSSSDLSNSDVNKRATTQNMGRNRNVIVKGGGKDESDENQSDDYMDADDGENNEAKSKKNKNNHHNNNNNNIHTVGVLNNTKISNITSTNNKTKSQKNKSVNEARKPTLKPKPAGLLLRSTSTSPEQDLASEYSTPPSSPSTVNGRYRNVNGRYSNLGKELAACIPKRQLKFGWRENTSSPAISWRRSLSNSNPSLSHQDFYSSEEEKNSLYYSYSSQCSSNTVSPQPPSSFIQSKSQRLLQQQQQEEAEDEEEEQQGTARKSKQNITVNNNNNNNNNKTPPESEEEETEIGTKEDNNNSKVKNDNTENDNNNDNDSITEIIKGVHSEIGKKHKLSLLQQEQTPEQQQQQPKVKTSALKEPIQQWGQRKSTTTKKQDKEKEKVLQLHSTTTSSLQKPQETATGESNKNIVDTIPIPSQNPKEKEKENKFDPEGEVESVSPIKIRCRKDLVNLEQNQKKKSTPIPAATTTTPTTNEVILVEVIRKKLSNTNSPTAARSGTGTGPGSGLGSGCVSSSASDRSSCDSHSNYSGSGSDLESDSNSNLLSSKPPKLNYPSHFQKSKFTSDPNFKGHRRHFTKKSPLSRSVEFSDHLEYIENPPSSSQGEVKEKEQKQNQNQDIVKKVDNEKLVSESTSVSPTKPQQRQRQKQKGVESEEIESLSNSNSDSENKQQDNSGEKNSPHAAPAADVVKTHVTTSNNNNNNNQTATSKVVSERGQSEQEASEGKNKKTKEGEEAEEGKENIESLPPVHSATITFAPGISDQSQAKLPSNLSREEPTTKTTPTSVQHTSSTKTSVGKNRRDEQEQEASNIIKTTVRQVQDRKDKRGEGTINPENSNLSLSLQSQTEEEKEIEKDSIEDQVSSSKSLISSLSSHTQSDSKLESPSKSNNSNSNSEWATTSTAESEFDSGSDSNEVERAVHAHAHASFEQQQQYQQDSPSPSPTASPSCLSTNNPPQPQILVLVEDTEENTREERVQILSVSSLNDSDSVNNYICSTDEDQSASKCVGDSLLNNCESSINTISTSECSDKWSLSANSTNSNININISESDDTKSLNQNQNQVSQVSSVLDKSTSQFTVSSTHQSDSSASSSPPSPPPSPVDNSDNSPIRASTPIMDRGKNQGIASVKIPVQAVNKHCLRSDCSSDEFEPEVIWRNSLRDSFRGFCAELLQTSSASSAATGNGTKTTSMFPHSNANSNPNLNQGKDKEHDVDKEGTRSENESSSLVSSSSSSSSVESEMKSSEKIVIHVPQPQSVVKPQNGPSSSSGVNEGVIEFEEDEDEEEEDEHEHGHDADVDEEGLYDEDDRCSSHTNRRECNNSIEYISVLDNIQIDERVSLNRKRSQSQGSVTTHNNSHKVSNVSDDHYTLHPKPVKWIISLDLGSKMSGYSFWSYCDPDVVHIGNWSGDGCTHKIPSWVNYSQHSKSNSNINTNRTDNKNTSSPSPSHLPKNMSAKVGQEALDEYTETRGKNSLSEENLFVSQWRESLELDSNEGNHHSQESTQNIDFSTLISSLIYFFGQAAIHQIQTKSFSHFNKSDSIEWLVSVPSSWSSPSRKLIRDAALKSGIIKSGDGINLIEDSMAISFFASANCRDEYENFLALDIGGSFLHCSGFELKYGNMHQTLQGRSLQLPTPEATFVSLLSQIVSREFISYYKAKYRPGWIRLMRNFEDAKCKFDNCNNLASAGCTHSSISATSAFVFLPSSFVIEFNRYTGMEVSECLAEHNSGITWNENGALCIPSQEMRMILKPTLNFILNKIESILMKYEYENLVLSGGFAKSKFLNEAIKSKFPELKLLFPKEFANAVLQGSTLSLMKTVTPKLIIKSPFSIGVGVLKTFDASIHPEEKRIVKDGKEWCADAFDTLISYGQEMELNSVVSKRSYVGAQPGQVSLVLPLYKSSASSIPRLVTEKSVQKCCELRFECPSQATWQEIDLLISCRASELIIQAIERDTSVHKVVIDLI